MKFGAKERLANYTKYTEKSFLPLTLAHILRWPPSGSYVSQELQLLSRTSPQRQLSRTLALSSEPRRRKVIKMNCIL